MPVMTYEELSESARSMARHVGEQFDRPDEDWRCIILLNGVELTIADMQEVINNDKPNVGLYLEALFRQYKPVSVAMIVSVWCAFVRNDDPMVETSIELMNRLGVFSRPDRQEALFVHTADLERADEWWAPIIRHKDKPPTLGEFTDFGAEAANMGGRLDDILRKTLQKVNRRRGWYEEIK